MQIPLQYIMRPAPFPVSSSFFDSILFGAVFLLDFVGIFCYVLFCVLLHPAFGCIFFVAVLHPVFAGILFGVRLHIFCCIQKSRFFGWRLSCSEMMSFCRLHMFLSPSLFVYRRLFLFFQFLFFLSVFFV